MHARKRAVLDVLERDTCRACVRACVSLAPFTLNSRHACVASCIATQTTLFRFKPRILCDIGLSEIPLVIGISLSESPVSASPGADFHVQLEAYLCVCVCFVCVRMCVCEGGFHCEKKTFAKRKFGRFREGARYAPGSAATSLEWFPRKPEAREQERTKFAFVLSSPGGYSPPKGRTPNRIPILNLQEDLADIVQALPAHPILRPPHAEFTSIWDPQPNLWIPLQRSVRQLCLTPGLCYNGAVVKSV